MRNHRSGGCAALTSLIVFGSLALCGCNQTTPGSETDAHAHGHEHDHDHGHRPDSLHEAVEQLAEIRQVISSAIEAGDAEAAHEPLHKVAELLEAVPDIAAETDLPKEEWEAVKAASERLFEAYGVIDKAFHVSDGDKQAAYEQVADELTSALEEIRSRLPMTGEEAPAGDHDDQHDDEDHEDHEDDGHEHDAEDQADTQESGAGS